MAQLGSKPTPPIDLASFDWAGDGLRARRLHWFQACILILFTVAAVFAVLGISRPIASATQGLRANQALADELQLLRDEVASEHTAMWRNLAKGATSLSPTSKLKLLGAQAYVERILAEDASGDPELRRIGDELREVVRTGSAMVANIPDVVDPGTEAGARWMVEADREMKQALATAEEWIARQRELISEASSQAEATAKGSVTDVGAILVALALAVALIGAWTARVRASLLAALQVAADQLTRRAVTDPLTGLLNHGAFHETLGTAVPTAKAERLDLSLALIDLDHFKQINDTFGHPVGDQVLVGFATLLAEMTREGDVVARVGGEEFAWMMPGATPDQAFDAVERLRFAVSRRPFGPVEAVSISIGVAELTDERDSGDLVRLADSALYWAKAHGRNATVRYSPDNVEELSVEERSERLDALTTPNSVRASYRTDAGTAQCFGRETERPVAE